MTSMNPRPVCVACTTREIHWDELVCKECWPTVEAMGLFQAPDSQPLEGSHPSRGQIGPLDI